MSKKVLRMKTLKLILFAVGTLFFLKITFNLVYYSPKSTHEILLERINDFINLKNAKFPPNEMKCKIPVLDVNASEILQFIKPVSPVVCNSTKDWVIVKGSTAKITDWAKNTHGNLECSFTDIVRITDHVQHQGMTTSSKTEFNLENSDAVIVHCATEQGVTWKKVLSGIRSDQTIFDRSGWSKTPQDSLKLNVLMFGFDSLSHNSWKRNLQKTYKYATQDLKGIALNGYNIVGDGTPCALIPILTGRSEMELPVAYKTLKEKAHFVDVFPFIWNNFRNNGYVTAWSEDMIHVGTFTYRFKGFKEQPVDHYMRTFYQEASPSFKHEKNYCYGEMTRFQLILDFVINMYEVYPDRPKFIFAFHSEYSHEDFNNVAAADEDVYNWLRDFHQKGYLNNTLLILMSDHGARFTAVRRTQQGKQEERLPGFIFVFPDWFEKKYPEAHANFVINADRLTTPFDIHETLKNVLHFKGAGKGNLQHRGISLFKEIPSSRTCQDANIMPHWCSCLDWEPLPTSNGIVKRAADYLLNFINGLTSNHRKLCSELQVNKILWSFKWVPNESVVKYKKNIDNNGFVCDMSDQMTVSTHIYQLQVSFDPGNMTYEASIRYHTKTNEFVVTENEISRIDKYKHMTHCIEDADILHHLRKFCFCV